jgi:hypothetical protein
MNGIERRVRNMINPYSTAFAGWWCHSGNRTRLGRIIAAASRWPGRAAPGPDNGLPEAGAFRPPALSMEARRAAIDAVLASPRGESEDEASAAGS